MTESNYRLTIDGLDEGKTVTLVNSLTGSLISMPGQEWDAFLTDVLKGGYHRRGGQVPDVYAELQTLAKAYEDRDRHTARAAEMAEEAGRTDAAERIMFQAEVWRQSAKALRDILGRLEGDTPG